MDFNELIANINFWAVLIAAASTFVVGWLWYGPLFGKKWMQLNGFTEESLKEGDGLPMGAIMGFSFLGSLLAAFALALFFGPEADLKFGIFAGVMISVFWIGTSRINDVLYEKKPFELFLINTGYNLVSFIVMGMIIGAWN